MTDQVTEITCPECERVWPTIAEQGIVCEIYDKCYACLIAEVVKIRDQRAEDRDYIVQNCGYCGGLNPKVNTCVQCAGKGWETVTKELAAVPKIAYPH